MLNEFTEINDNTPKVYLSRRNLLTLLSKLNREESGEETHCMIIKFKQPGQAAYQQTMDELAIIAVPDEEYYPAQNRTPGAVHLADEPFTEEKYT